MSKKPSPEKEALDLNLRAQFHDQPIGEDTKRFNIFLIDTCWNAPVSKLVRESLPTLHELHPNDSLYILSREQSLELLRYAPEWIGRDPVILLYDLHTDDATRPCRFHGFRLSLGLFRHAEQAAARLHEFLRFLAHHRKAVALEREVRRELHREGLDGMLKVLSETSAEFLA
jgi:hypothetical protein